jgi:hypothetical protein
MTEHDLQNIIRKELSKLGFLTIRANVGKVKMKDGRWFDSGLPKGFPDLMAFKNGKTFFIEVKGPGGKARKEQKKFIEIIQGLGFNAGIARSMKDVKKIVEEEL